MASSEEFCSVSKFQNAEPAAARILETPSTQQSAWCLQIAGNALQLLQCAGRDLKTAQIVPSPCTLQCCKLKSRILAFTKQNSEDRAILDAADCDLLTELSMSGKDRAYSRGLRAGLDVRVDWAHLPECRLRQT